MHRTAGRLEPVLAGKTIVSFEAARLLHPGPQPGTMIETVEANGKYLLVHFADGTTLETHMKMSGSWHIYKKGERWRRSRSAARVAIETDEGWVAVCFSAPHVKLMARSDGPDHLGPDLCRADPDLAEAADRFSLCAVDTPSAVALLDQRVCCGVGNVYKSEVLFACGISPDRPVEQLTRDERLALVTMAHQMLRSNLGSGPRVTVPGVGLAVYGRRGLPCHRCGEPISHQIQGVHARSTYWCARCQPSS